MVDYAKSLERYQIRLHEGYAGWQANVLARVYSALQASDLSIESLKAKFDSNKDGHVTAAEVMDVLASFNLALSRPQLERALLWMNMDEGSRFDASTFISQLYLMCHDNARASKGSRQGGAEAGDDTQRTRDTEDEAGARGGRSRGAAEATEYSMVHLSDGTRVDGVEYVSGLLTHLVDVDKDGQLSPSEMRSVSEHLWAMIDTDGDGYLSYAEFADAIMRLLADDEKTGHSKRKDKLKATSLSREHALHLAARIDVCNTGHICFLEFLPLFISANSQEGTALQGSNSALIQHVSGAPHTPRAAWRPPAWRLLATASRHDRAPSACVHCASRGPASDLHAHLPAAARAHQSLPVLRQGRGRHDRARRL